MVVVILSDPPKSVLNRFVIDVFGGVLVLSLCLLYFSVVVVTFERKRKRSDSVLWQMPLHQQNCEKGQSDNTNNATKSSITQRLRTDLGRADGVITATQLVWLTGLRAQPSQPWVTFLPFRSCIWQDVTVVESWWYMFTFIVLLIWCSIVCLLGAFVVGLCQICFFFSSDGSN